MSFNTGIEKELNMCPICGELYWSSNEICNECKRYNIEKLIKMNEKKTKIPEKKTKIPEKKPKSYLDKVKERYVEFWKEVMGYVRQILYG